VQTGSGEISTWETQSNVKAGIVNLYENGEIVGTFKRSQIKDAHMLAFYHKAMPFEDIIALAKEKHTPKTKKYHNKNFDKVIEVK
jgi:hypothetical protein